MIPLVLLILLGVGLFWLLSRDWNAARTEFVAWLIIVVGGLAVVTKLQKPLTAGVELVVYVWAWFVVLLPLWSLARFAYKVYRRRL